MKDFFLISMKIILHIKITLIIQSSFYEMFFDVIQMNNTLTDINDILDLMKWMSNEARYEKWLPKISITHP